MSRDARDWAWSLPDLPPSTRLLLLALAEHVREGMTCFPGQARLAARCGVSDRQVRNLLQELQGRGLISVEHRPGQGGGRKSNLYRLAMGNRQPDSYCPEGYLEAGFRNAGSGCAQATGNPAPGNRHSGAGNRNPVSAEPEERNVRKKLRDTPPYPPTGGDFDHGQDDFSSSQRTSPGGQSTSTPLVQPRGIVSVEVAAVEVESQPDRAGKQGRGPFPRQGTDPPAGVQAPERRTNSRRGKRNGADQRLAEKDYTVGATRDEDLPDWASGWRDRTHVAE